MTLQFQQIAECSPHSWRLLTNAVPGVGRLTSLPGFQRNAKRTFVTRSVAYHLPNGELHRSGAPAQVRYCMDGAICEAWYLNGELHRSGAPAQIWYHKDGTIQHERWYLNGELHRSGAPAQIWYHSDGTINNAIWYLNGKQHRSMFPSRIWYDSDGTSWCETW